MAVKTTKRLYIVYGTQAGKEYTLSLLDPNPGLDYAAVNPVAQLAIDGNLILRNDDDPVTSVNDIYIREITDTELTA